MSFASKWTLRLVGAGLLIAAVHVFMLTNAVPRPAAWYLGSLIYAGLVAVLFSRRSLFDKIATYFVFVVVTIVGIFTVCPCTLGHFFLAPLAGLGAVGLVHLVKRRFLQRAPIGAPAEEPLSTSADGPLR
jgi:hypothetical protein